MPSICTQTAMSGPTTRCEMPNSSGRDGCCPALSTLTHPGFDQPGPLDTALLRSDLAEHLAAGVTMLRAPGLAGDPPAWFGVDTELPRAVHAGPWIAQHGQFIDGMGRRAQPEYMPGIAAAQAARSGWAKLIGDWRQDDPALSENVLRQVVAAMHAVGGRLAVHAQTKVGALSAANAGVDSIEHGQGLDPDLLPMLADRGTALTPTLRVIEQALQFRLARGDDPAVPWMATAAMHGQLAAAAVEAGVQVLAGTDSRPHGRVADEIRSLAATGMRPHDALAAGSWSARAFLGLPGLAPGAPADVVIYDQDPGSTCAASTTRAPSCCAAESCLGSRTARGTLAVRSHPLCVHDL